MPGAGAMHPTLPSRYIMYLVYIPVYIGIYVGLASVGDDVVRLSLRELRQAGVMILL